DHIDGLHDPLEYLRQLQSHLRSEINTGSSLEFYVVVEKILSGDETLPGDWPVAGTTGYDFLSSVNTLFVNQDGIETIKSVYRRRLNIRSSYDDIVYEKKKQIIAQLFPGDIEALGLQLVELALHDRDTNIPQADLMEAIIEVISCLPVYRTYIRDFEVSPRDQLYLRHAIKEAYRRNPRLDSSSLDFLDHVLLLNFPSDLPQERKKIWLRFVMRCQQFTGAIMAKSLEDTTFYTYTPLLSLNDVGEDPGASGFSMESFHTHNKEVMAHWPHTLNTTSTHDTKRGEDVRARLNVLSELPEEWEIHLNRWFRMNRSAKTPIDGQRSPDSNTEVLLYQTMLGSWPFMETEVTEFRERLKSYMIKAVREGKTVSDWAAPNQDYEQALLLFIDHLFQSRRFLDDFLPFQKKIAHYGVFNSLSQTLLKITSPGVPDFYQGTELWDLSMVDPDNRRPVDYIQRRKALDNIITCETQGSSNLVGKLLDSRHNGAIKLYVIYKTLGTRLVYKRLFQEGDYLPIQTTGPRSINVCAFARRLQDTWAIALAPRMLTSVIREDEFPLGEQVWKDSKLSLPEGSPPYWSHILTGEVFEATDKSNDLLLGDVFDTAPLALLLGHI
ncbi:MAG: malto-oligosyltrehalose synthase, partial [Chloroflexota bacterium]|nr:malto-oligosyltrehalose synthase [Chloroflexota bacterium]